ELQRYLAALRALDGLFTPTNAAGPSPRDLHRDFRDALERAHNAAQILADTISARLDRIEAEVLVHLQELLKTVPARLHTIQALYTRAREALHADPASRGSRIRDCEAIENAERATEE